MMTGFSPYRVVMHYTVLSHSSEGFDSSYHFVSCDFVTDDWPGGSHDCS